MGSKTVPLSQLEDLRKELNAVDRVLHRPVPYGRVSFVEALWHIADLAYSVYVRHGGGDQSLERLAERGGFGAVEMDNLLPDWRERVETYRIQQKAVERG